MTKTNIPNTAAHPATVTLAASLPTLDTTRSTDAPRLSILAYTGEPLSLGYAAPIVIDLAGMKPADTVPILINHNTDPDYLAGMADEIRNTGDRLELTATLLGGGSPKVARFLELALAGIPWQASVGIAIENAVQIPAGETLAANNRTYEGPVIHVTASTLKEVSITLIAADPNTHTTLAKGHTMTAARQPNDPRKNDPAAPTPQPPAQQPDPTPDPAAQLRAAAAAEAARIADITAVTKDHPDICAKAIAEGWDRTRTELEVLRAARPAPAVHVPDAEPNANALTAALCLSVGIPENHLLKAYSQETLDAAHMRYRRATLHTLLYETLRAAGKTLPPGKIDSDTIRAAFEADRMLKAASAYSTVSLTATIQGVANRALLNAYEAVAAVAPIIAYESDVADFKQAQRYRLTSLDTFDKVAPSGQLKHAAVADTAYTNQADTYGVVLTLDRKTIINDDLGMFLQLPRAIGRRAAIQRERAVFELLLANPSNFFSSGNKNLLTGPDTALSITGLTKAEQALADQTDDSGHPILITGAILLVPTSLKALAQNLMTETRVNETTATGKPAPAANPHAGKWQPVASPFLNAQGLTGSSANAWYLMASPQDVAAIEIVYVQGRRVPTVETGEPDFDTLGISFRAYWDFGVALQDPKAIVKCTGE